MINEPSERMTSSYMPPTTRRLAVRLLTAATLSSCGVAFLGHGSEAKKNHNNHNNHNNKPKTVTRSFANPGVITIPAGGAATPYPSSIQVSGFKKARVTALTLALRGYSHKRPTDVDVMLVAPDGRNAIVMADIGNGTPVVDITIVLDDLAGPPPDLPANVPLPGGTYRPTNILLGEDPFTGGPAPSGAVALSTFNGIDPNGNWQLFVFDDQGGSSGAIAGGWELTITAEVKKNKK